MSEPFPERDFPLDPDELARIEELIRAAQVPDATAAVIETAAAIHARWYYAWQGAGIPEQRAAEWAEIMIANVFRAAS